MRSMGRMSVWVTNPLSAKPRLPTSDRSANVPGSDGPGADDGAAQSSRSSSADAGADASLEVGPISLGNSGVLPRASLPPLLPYRCLRKAGAIVKSPTVGVIAEKEPEAVVPVKKLAATKAGRKIIRMIRAKRIEDVA